MVSKLQNKLSIFLIAAIILLLAILSLTVKNFATPNNFRNILIQVAPIGIMTFGVTFVMITGGIDISLPAIMATSSVISADYIAKSNNIFLGIILFFFVSALLGLINGTAVAYLKMVPLVVTLSMMTICLGIATAWTDGQSVGGLPREFSQLFPGGTVIFIFLSLAIFLGIVLKNSMYGRRLYYIGNNENTAISSGLPVRKDVCLAYVIAALCAGVAGLINTAALSSARASMGAESQILDVVSAAVIGGVSVKGGSGSILGAFLGATLIIMINNVLNLIGMSDYYTGLIKGLIIILAMGIESARTRIVQS